MYSNLLKLLRNKSNIGTGLTIPFVIGVLKKDNQSNQLTISELLFDIVNNAESEVMLRFCNEIGEFILTISPNFILAKRYIKHLKFDQLLVVPEKNLKGLSELDHMIASLEIDYAKYINEGNFSKRGEDWYEFDENDENFIKNSLKFQ